MESQGFASKVPLDLTDYSYLGSNVEVSAPQKQLYQCVKHQQLDFQLLRSFPLVFVSHMILFHSGPQTLWENTQNLLKECSDEALSIF